MTTRRYEVVFRPAAEADLLALYRYLAETVGPARAASYVGRIEAACMTLASSPERGTRRDDVLPGLRTLGFEHRVTLAFRILDDQVEIMAVAYGGREFDAAF